MKEYLWMLVDDGHYVLEYVENTKTRIIRHELNYPINENKNGWCFFTGKYMDGEAFKREEWDLPTEEQKEIKNYIRNVLKPSDLYEESEGKKMEDMKILNVAVPSDLADEVMSIVARFEGVPVEGDINLSAQQELEVCKADKENLLKELKLANDRVYKTNQDFIDLLDDATICIQSIIDDIKKDFDADCFKTFMNKFTDEQIERYGLEKYKEEKYKITRVKAIKTITTEILVLEKDNDDSNPEGVLEEAEDFQIDGYFDSSYNCESEYDYEEQNVVTEGKTKEEIVKCYSQESVFYADDCEDIWN